MSFDASPTRASTGVPASGVAGVSTVAVTGRDGGEVAFGPERFAFASYRRGIYLTDLQSFALVNEVYGSFFESDPPARVAFGVAALPKGAQVEIDAILALPD